MIIILQSRTIIIALKFSVPNTCLHSKMKTCISTCLLPPSLLPSYNIHKSLLVSLLRASIKLVSLPRFKFWLYYLHRASLGHLYVSFFIYKMVISFHSFNTGIQCLIYAHHCSLYQIYNIHMRFVSFVKLSCQWSLRG